MIELASIVHEFTAKKQASPVAANGGVEHFEPKFAPSLLSASGQELVLGRDQRVLADQLAKGKVAVMIGLTYYSFLPFIKAGLPIKALPTLKDGTYGTGGSGNLAVIKDPPHPNATKIFVNWLLSREGQELSSKALGQATHRLDVDTKALKEIAVLAAKDVMSSRNTVKLLRRTHRRPASTVFDRRYPQSSQLARSLEMLARLLAQ